MAIEIPIHTTDTHIARASRLARDQAYKPLLEKHSALSTCEESSVRDESQTSVRPEPVSFASVSRVSSGTMARTKTPSTKKPQGKGYIGALLAF